MQQKVHEADVDRLVERILQDTSSETTSQTDEMR